MSERLFLDTNVIIYASDPRDTAKQTRAAEIVAQCLREETGVVSTQVLQEYASVALTKLRQDEAVVLRILHLLEKLTVVPTSPRLIRRQVELRRVYGISFWDAGIVVAAEEAGCERLLGEDFNAGQYYSGILAVNPFA